MPDGFALRQDLDRVCPHLRGRYRSEPNLTPSDANSCVLAAFIHLPQPQQSRYCLGGQYTTCARYIRQRTQPLPRYLTGIPSVAAPPPQVPATLPTLWWRLPFGRVVLRAVVIILFVGLVVLGWRWRTSSLSIQLTPRPPLPTAIPAPTLTPPDLFSQPTVGPPAH